MTWVEGNPAPTSARHRACRKTFGMLVNDERLYVDANPAACRLLRCARETLLRMSIDDLAAQSPETVIALWKAFLESGTQSGRFAIRRLDGSEVEVNYSATADVIPGVHLSVLAPIDDEDELDSESPADSDPISAAALTHRERQVMTLLALGATTSERRDRTRRGGANSRTPPSVGPPRSKRRNGMWPSRRVRQELPPIFVT